jgi:hypothetical protein
LLILVVSLQRKTDGLASFTTLRPSRALTLKDKTSRFVPRCANAASSCLRRKFTDSHAGNAQPFRVLKKTRFGTDSNHGESNIHRQPPCMWAQTSPLPAEIQAFSFALQNNLAQNP